MPKFYKLPTAVVIRGPQDVIKDAPVVINADHVIAMTAGPQNCTEIALANGWVVRVASPADIVLADESIRGLGELVKLDRLMK